MTLHEPTQKNHRTSSNHLQLSSNQPHKRLSNLNFNHDPITTNHPAHQKNQTTFHNSQHPTHRCDAQKINFMKSVKRVIKITRKRRRSDKEFFPSPPFRLLLVAVFFLFLNCDFFYYYGSWMDFMNIYEISELFGCWVSWGIFVGLAAAG
jgi:hypothetical protein